jgi:hypothetical protein
MFPVYSGNYFPRTAVHNWDEKLSQGRSEVAADETEVRKWLNYSQ